MREIVALLARGGARSAAAPSTSASAGPTPIMASDEVLAHACPADSELQARAVRRWLDDLSSTDFDDRGAVTD